MVRVGRLERFDSIAAAAAAAAVCRSAMATLEPTRMQTEQDNNHHTPLTHASMCLSIMCVPFVCVPVCACDILCMYVCVRVG